MPAICPAAFPIISGVVDEALPKAARDDLLFNGLSGPQGVGEVLKSSPVHRKPDHPDKRSHRLRMIRSQQARCWRVAPRVVTRLKDPLRRKDAQRARQRARMCSGVPRKLLGSARGGLPRHQQRRVLPLHEGTWGARDSSKFVTGRRRDCSYVSVSRWPVFCDLCLVTCDLCLVL